MSAYGINWLLTELDLMFPAPDLLHRGDRLGGAAGRDVHQEFSPSLFRSLGIFLPLITTNCAILGLAPFQTAKNTIFCRAWCMRWVRGWFTLALLLMSGLREKLELAEVPAVSQGRR